MAHCFVLGKDSEKLELFRVIEYLKYDFTSEPTVEISADFFVKNLSDREVSLRFLHPRDVSFSTREQKDVDPNWEILRELYNPVYFKLDRSPSSGITFSNSYKERNKFFPLEIKLKPSIENTDWEDAPFSLYETEGIKKGNYVIRIKGVYPRKEENLRYFHIFGGDILLNKIEKKGLPSVSNPLKRQKYTDIFNEFKNKYYAIQERYDIFAWESTGAERIKMYKIFPDLTLEKQGCRVGDKLVTWSWSRTGTYDSLGIRDCPSFKMALVKADDEITHGQKRKPSIFSKWLVTHGKAK